MNWINLLGILGMILLYGGLILFLCSPLIMIISLFAGVLAFKIGTFCFLFGFASTIIGGLLIVLASYLQSNKRL